MKLKTSELEGALLDAAVAKASGIAGRLVFDHETTSYIGDDVAEFRLYDAHLHWEDWRVFSPGRKWEDGGPIIDREHISLVGFDDGEDWGAQYGSAGALSWGKTPLIAAMRAYIASVFGEEVELPD